MKNYILTIFMLAGFTTSIIAQNDANPWSITVGTNAVDLSQDTPFKDNISLSPNFSYLSVSRYLCSGFSLDLGATINNIDRDSGSEDLYYSIEFGTTLSANEIIDLGDFEPSLSLALGYTDGLTFSGSEQDFFTINSGVGLKYWFNDTFALSVKSTYKAYTKEFDNLIEDGSFGENHFQHLAGLTFAFGDGDIDRDGVKDNIDECPEVPGLESFNGCPDDDGDGIKNSDDDCPTTAGLAALNGCPDADGDGIKDSDDACPNVAGVASMNGCPDSDGDGIIDTDDNCPNAAGDKAMNGCPDSDGDGVSDKDDDCPLVVGPASNKGCPEYPLSILSDFNINFDLEKYNIDSDDVQRLSTVIKVLLANSQAKISIEGHADNSGEESFNNPLSKNRASSIKDYLVNVGIDMDRLSIKAFGESMPKASNDSKEGRAINRRVEFKAVN